MVDQLSVILSSVAGFISRYLSGPLPYLCQRCKVFFSNYKKVYPPSIFVRQLKAEKKNIILLEGSLSVFI